MMNDFDFNNIEVTDETTGDDDFDFDAVFDGDEPDFDRSILDEPIGDYGDDPDGPPDDDGGAGVRTNPKPPKQGPGHGKALPKERELAHA